MGQFRFRVPEMRDSTPQEWLTRWAKRYEDQTDYDDEYNRLMEIVKRHEPFLAEHFTRIGKWKDGVTTDRQWKPNVASVAYLVWQQAAEATPTCPEECDVQTFLEGWSDKAYTDTFKKGPKKKHFGLSRATTLLHFVSGGRYPIFDSRVKTAIARLLNHPELPGNVSSYLDSYVPLFKELAECCATLDFRMLDKALFSYGAFEETTF
jgi:hypothetical protein